VKYDNDLHANASL